MPKVFAELYRRDKALALTGWLHVALLAVMLVAAFYDTRTILGINPWIKPMKFASSIAIYVWTLAWFLDYVAGPNWVKRLISYVTSLGMVVEIVCISLQSIRGTTYHFNIHTAFDSAIFIAMGIFIGANMFLAAFFLLILFLKPEVSPPAYLWSVRLSVFITILAGIEGTIMITHFGHSVGRDETGPEPIVPTIEEVDGRRVNTANILRDGDPGLAIVNFSTEGGDLRIAHGWGLHALQVIPFFGFIVSRRRNQFSDLTAMTLVLGFTALYTAVGIFLFYQAVQGYPLIPS